MSELLSNRARAALPGGVSHELRYRDPHPIYFERAAGAEKWDSGGRRYLDFKMGSAAVLLGHGHPDVVEAIRRQAQKLIFSADCHELEIEWAEWVNGLFPSAERTRFTASGSEATMLALRLGRAWSGKERILRIDGHYHGWHDHVARGSKAGSLQPNSLGIPQAVTDLIEVCAADPLAVGNALQDETIGTLILEASGSNYGCIPIDRETLGAIQAVTRTAGVVLVFDEVISGFRWSPGGRQARDGLMPDLTTLAKVVTGGLPGGAVCGRAEIMELMNNAESRNGFSPPVSHKGTFNASPLVAAGAVAAMPHLATGEAQAQADTMAARMREGMDRIIDEVGVDACAYGDSSVIHLHFGHRSLQDLSPAEIRGVSPDIIGAYRNGMLERGVDIMSFTSAVTSAAHRPEHIDEALDAFRGTLQAMLELGILG